MKLSTIHCVLFAAIALCAIAGCRVVEVERSATGEYRAYYNSHWFSTEADSITAGMNPDGSFNLSLSGVKTSPSEEFNRMMATTMGTFSQIMQIAAAAYNPSASAVSLTNSQTAQESCPDGRCTIK